MDRSDRYFPKQLVSLVPNFELLQIPIALQLILRPINIADVLTLWSIVTSTCCTFRLIRCSSESAYAFTLPLCDPPIGGCIHPVYLSVRPSVCPVPTVNWETEYNVQTWGRCYPPQASILSSKDQSARTRGHWGRKCENRFWPLFSRKMYRFT